MDASITKVLQAVQEEFPPTRKPRRQSSNHSNASSHSPSIPTADDNSLPTSSELYTYSGQSPDPNSSSSFALSTSPQDDGLKTPRAERTAYSTGNQASASSTATPELLSQRENVSSSSSMPDPPFASTSSSNSKQSNNSTQAPFQSTSSNQANQRSPKTRSAPTFISLPPMSSNNANASSAGFKLSTNKSEGLMLTPGGDDLPFVFKKRPNMQERRPSHEIFA